MPVLGDLKIDIDKLIQLMVSGGLFAFVLTQWAELWRNSSKAKKLRKLVIHEVHVNYMRAMNYLESLSKIQLDEVRFIVFDDNLYRAAQQAGAFGASDKDIVIHDLYNGIDAHHKFGHLDPLNIHERELASYYRRVLTVYFYCSRVKGLFKSEWGRARTREYDLEGLMDTYIPKLYEFIKSVFPETYVPHNWPAVRTHLTNPPKWWEVHKQRWYLEKAVPVWEKIRKFN